MFTLYAKHKNPENVTPLDPLEFVEKDILIKSEEESVTFKVPMKELLD
jgi:hypothetical protein